MTRLSVRQSVVLAGLLAGGLTVGLAPAPSHARNDGDSPAGSINAPTLASHRSGEGRENGQVGTTLDDQVDLALTVYNSNIALIRDTRALSLPEGVFDLSYIDIAATIKPGDGPLPVADPA